MFDIHSHVIFGLDDGACNLNESLCMINEAEKVGVRHLIATPHYQEKLFETDRVVENFNELKHHALNFDVELKLGAEVFLDPLLPEKLEQNKLLILNETRYVLFDTSFGSIPPFLYQVIDKLIETGYQPILAHPARNRFYFDHFYILEELSKHGCMFQLDAGCITGVYGRAARSLAKKILKQGMAQFVASNAHCPQDYLWLSQAKLILRKWVGEEEAEKLLVTNARSIMSQALRVTA